MSQTGDHRLHNQQGTTISTNGTSTGSQNDECALIIMHSPLENDESLKNARVGFPLEQLYLTNLDSHFGV